MEENPFRLRILAGPNIRCAFPAVEFSFPEDPQFQISRGQLSQLLAMLGLELEGDNQNDLWTLSEAIGKLSSALQPLHAQRWACGGVEGEARSWVCLEYHDMEVTRRSLSIAYRALKHPAETNARQLLKDLQRHVEYAVGHARHGIVHVILNEAIRRGIPIYEVSANPPVWQLGQGQHGLHYLETAQQFDSMIGSHLQTSKLASCELLKRLGFPHTNNRLVSTAEQAIKAAQEIEFPCVVKPVDGSLGRGVSVGLRSNAEITRAFSEAKHHSRGGGVLVENLVEGQDHRMAVFGGQLAWAVTRTPPAVIGDGQHNIRQLVEIENRRRRHDRKATFRAKPIPIDEALIQFIQSQGLNLNSIIEKGLRVTLTGRSNQAQGGTVEDVTARVHPDNLWMAETIAGCFRLESMGLDFMTQDISVSWKDSQCAVVEVNALPGINGARGAHQVILSSFPWGSKGRIPCLLIVADDTSSLVANSVKEFREQGLRAGFCDSTSLGLDTHKLLPQLEQPLPVRARALALNPAVQAIVIGCCEADIVRFGLPLDHFDVIAWCSPQRTKENSLRELLNASTEELIEFSDGQQVAVAAWVSGACRQGQLSNQHTRMPCVELISVAESTGEASDRVVTARISSWPTPCVPLYQLFDSLERIVGEPLDAVNENLLTRDGIPYILCNLLRTMLGKKRSDGGQTLEATWPTEDLPNWNALQGEYVIAFQQIDLAVAQACLEWAIEAVNHLMDGYVHKQDPSVLEARLTDRLQETLLRIQQLHAEQS